MMGKRILVVEDDESLRRVTQFQLEQAGYQVSTACDGSKALGLLEKASQDLVLTDLMMPGLSGLDLLKRIRANFPETIVILVTAHGTVESAVEAMKVGAYDFITKPIHPDALILLINRALEHHQLRKEVGILRSSLDQKYGFENIIGRSGALLGEHGRTADTRSPAQSCSPGCEQTS